jgi:uncharacterized lipoprotein YehR (DUF1307 family)
MKKNMKILAAIVGVIVILSLTGCKKEPANLIIGTWQETEVTYTETVNGETSEPLSMLEPGETVTMTFNKDNTYTGKTVSEDITFDVTGTWFIEDNKITITQNEDDLGFGSMIYDIDLLDKKNMTLIYTETDEEDSSHTASIVIKMKRI